MKKHDKAKHDKTNPIASVDAIINPAPLTIAQVALLSRIDSPVLYGKILDVNKCLEAMFLLSLPVSEAVRHIDTVEDGAIVWSAEALPTHDAYVKKLGEVLDAITAFWKMLPSADPKKKASGTVTAGSPNSRNGRVAPMAGASKA